LKRCENLVSSFEIKGLFSFDHIGANLSLIAIGLHELLALLDDILRRHGDA